MRINSETIDRNVFRKMPFFTGSGRWSGKMAGNNNG